MRAFVLRRLAFILPQLLLVAAGVFLLLRVLPLDPVTQVVGFLGTPEARAQVEQQLGLHRSLGAQLWSYLGDLATLDFGSSWSTSIPVREEISQRFPVTIQLTALAFVLALAIAIPVGRAAALRHGGRADRSAMTYSLFAGAQPDFWWGLLFIFLLFYKAGIFPAPLGLLSPSVSPPEPITNFILVDALLVGDLEVFGNALQHYALPVLTLAFVLTGPLLKMTRNSVLSAVHSDYILYARASGLSARSIKRAVLRTSLAPVVTLSGILFGFMLGGAVLVEYVFTLDGLGLYALRRTLDVDFPAVQGAVVVMTAFSLLVYLLMDVLYAALDPRIRYGRG